MNVEFKENLKFSKIMLLETGRRLLDIIEQVKIIDKTIDELQKEPNFIFDISGRNDNLNINYNDLLDAVKLIQTKLGELELEGEAKKR